MGLVKLAALNASTQDAQSPPISPSGTGKSVLFATSGEELEDTSVSCKHVKDKVTIAYWAKQTVGGVGRSFLFMDGNAGGLDSTIFQMAMSGAANTRRLVLRNPGSATNIKLYDFAATANAWHHVAVVIDISAANPTNEQLIIYVDGAKVSPTKTTDDTLTSWANVVVTNMTNIGSALAGNMHSIAIWNTVLSADEVNAIYNSGVGTVDLSRRKGKYRSHKKLQHWFFFDTSIFGNLGYDYGKARTTENINILQAQTGLDSTNLVIDAPGY